MGAWEYMDFCDRRRDDGSFVGASRYSPTRDQQVILNWVEVIAETERAVLVRFVPRRQEYPLWGCGRLQAEYENIPQEVWIPKSALHSYERNYCGSDRPFIGVAGWWLRKMQDKFNIGELGPRS